MVEQTPKDVVETLRPDQLDAYINALRQMARPHLNGKLSWLDYNISDYPFQVSNLSHVAGSPLELKDADTISPLAQPGYLEGREAALEDDGNHQAIQEIGSILNENKNIVVVTAHDNIIDIIMALLAIRDLLVLVDPDKVPKSTATIVSKMVAHLQYTINGNHVPAVEVIKLFCNDIFMSFPRTATSEKALQGLSSDFTLSHNRQMVTNLKNLMGQGGVLLGVAATGTTRLKTNESTGQTTLADISSGTATLLTRDDTYAVAVELTLGDVFSIDRIGKPTRLTKDKLPSFMSSFNVSPVKPEGLGSIAVNS